MAGVSVIISFLDALTQPPKDGQQSALAAGWTLYSFFSVG
jgi:hypothetical protein